jgi:hypothetical protein
MNEPHGDKVIYRLYPVTSDITFSFFDLAANGFNNLTQHQIFHGRRIGMEIFQDGVVVAVQSRPDRA